MTVFSPTETRVVISIPLACTEPRCSTEKGKLDFRADGDVIFRFLCPNRHVQGVSIKRTLAAILKRNPDWLKNYVDESK